MHCIMFPAAGTLSYKNILSHTVTLAFHYEDTFFLVFTGGFGCYSVLKVLLTDIRHSVVYQ